MHVWIIEQKNSDGKYIPLTASAWRFREDVRIELRTHWKRCYPDFQYRIVKYTSTKGK